MNISIIGSKGAGKGTQIVRLKEKINLVRFSPGEVFTNAVRKSSPLGQIVQTYLGTARAVPSEIVNGLVQEWLWTTSPYHSVVFDGYPRTVEQASFVESVLKDMGRRLDAVIYLDVSLPTVIKRLSERRICRICKDEFHLKSDPFGHCLYSRCKGQYLSPLEQDEPDNVRAMVEAFWSRVGPVLELYRKENRLLVVDAELEIAEVHHKIIEFVTQLH